MSDSTPAEPSPSEVVFTHETRISRATADALWEAYRHQFEPLRDKALLCHMYEEADYRAAVEHPDVLKVVAWHDGRPVGLLTMTNNLEIVPQISPPFLYARYPEYAQRNAIFYLILLFVTPDNPDRATLGRLIEECAQVTGSHQGVCVIDVADINQRLAEYAALVVGTYDGSQSSRIDAQQYWAYEVPYSKQQ